MPQINIHEAKTHLSRLVEQAAAGKEVIIAKSGKPMVKLVAIKPSSKPRKPGALKGRISLGKDFDQPLSPEELAAWYGGALFP